MVVVRTYGFHMPSQKRTMRRLLLSLMTAVVIPLTVSLLGSLLLPEGGATILGGLVNYAGLAVGLIAAVVVYLRTAG